MTDPYEDERPEEIERKHAEKIAQTKRVEDEYRAVLGRDRRFLFVSWSRGGVHVEDFDGVAKFKALYVEGLQSPNFKDTIEKIIANGGFAKGDALWAMCEVTTSAAQPVDVEKMRAEVLALHSELGDASQTVFDMVERLRDKEAEAHTLRVKVGDLETRVGALKQQYERLKTQIGPLL